MDALVKIAELFLSPSRNGFPVLISLIGLAFAYFGYDLFRMGVQEGGAALHVAFGAEREFQMGKGGPGLIFCAFGMGLIIYAIRKFDKLRVQPQTNVRLNEHRSSSEAEDERNHDA